MKRLLLAMAVLAAFTFSSCRNSLRLSVVMPAQVDVPNDVQHIAVMNNSNKKKKDINRTIIKAVLHGELPEADRRAQEEAMRATVYRIPNISECTASAIGGNGVHDSLGEVDWPRIKSICDAEGAQLLITIEEFDTSSQPGGVVASNALGIPGAPLHGRARMGVFYPREEMQLNDLWVHDRYVIPTSGSLDPLSLIGDITMKKYHTDELGRMLGEQTAGALFPTWVWVHRRAYTKGSYDLKRSYRMIMTSDWQECDALLTGMLKHNKRKVRKRSHFNLALVKEAQGDLDAAMAHAKTAAVDYNCRMAFDYLRRLKIRQEEMAIVKWQEEN